MIKFYKLTLIAWTTLLAGLSHAQLVENFDNPATLSKIEMYADSLAPISIANNELSIVCSKDSLTHGFVYKFATLNLTPANAKVSLKFKSSNDVQISALLLDELSNIIAVASPQLLYAGPDFTTYNFDLNDTTFLKYLISQKIVIGQKTKVNQLAFQISQPYKTATNTTVKITDLKIGSNVVLPAKITTYTNSFSTDVVSTEWVSERNETFNLELAHKLNQKNGELTIDMVKTGFNGLWFYPGNTIVDMSKKTLISLRAKATKDVTMTLYLWSNTGLYAWTAIDIKIKASTEYKTYYFDFTEKLKSTPDLFIDASNIKAILINFNAGVAFRGAVTIDDLKIGDAVTELVNKAPTIAQQPDVTFANNAGRQVVKLQGITDGESDGYQKITVTGTNNFTDPYFSFSIVYSDGQPTANLELVPDDIETLPGEFLVKILVKDNGGTRNNGVDSTTISFKVIVTAPNGIEEATKNNGFNIYPNPAAEVLHIQAANSVDKVTISDATGKVLITKSSSFTGLMSLDIADLSKGLYFVKIEQGEKVFQKKIVK